MNPEENLHLMKKYIKQDAPMLKWLLSKGIPFDKEHKSYTFRHCEKRSQDNIYACVHGLMDLKVETWQEDNIQVVSVCFYYLQNGDMMRDPDITFKFSKRLVEIDQRFNQLGMSTNKDSTLMEFPLTYELSGMGIYKKTFVKIDGIEKIDLTLVKELQEMLKDTATHCREMNYQLVEADQDE